MPVLHSLLAGRWSPRAFDSRYEIGRTELTSLFEAARWAPSSGNDQPWRFVLGRRDDEAHKRILDCLGEDDQRWAWGASVLIAAAYVTTGSYRTRVAYDLGQAVAHLGLQATALGLHTHQIVDLDTARLHHELDLPRTVAVHAVVAVGRLGDPATLPDDLRRREFRLRERVPVEDLLLASVL
jgi:hypothetical protein